MIQKYLLNKLKVMGFIFALFGWLMIFIFMFGMFIDLVFLENVLRSSIFIWSLRIFVIGLIISLYFVDSTKIFKKYKKQFYVLFVGGIIGWLFSLLAIIFLI